ncbi:radial spoke head protein 3 homolog [Tamandua tetradactyla]|uniref:radial spoke head protein 3 homolog n=1 Tax=Tamandua tetradactyla TaxID=48850 RepID=UPI00405431F8
MGSPWEALPQCQERNRAGSPETMRVPAEPRSREEPRPTNLQPPAPTTAAIFASLARGPATRRRTCRGGAAERSQVPELLRVVGAPAKPVRQNSSQAPPADGTPSCSATAGGAAGAPCALCSQPSIAPTTCRSSLPSRQLRFLPPLRASRNPCPWHYSHLSGSHDTLAPTCFKAKLHRKGRSSTPDLASTVTDHSAPTMSTYTYTSRPRPLPCQRRRYRDNLLQPDEEPIRYGNIMYDRRVIRGNTYALQTLPLTSQPEAIELQRQQQAKRRALARKRAREQLRPRTPEPVEGRKHVDVQTELYLEEIADRIIEVDMECQTDAFLDRPPTPLFIPAKTGKDVATQILEGELFDFDLEVKPMLEVLVGKTIEQSLLEVMEEEELANLRANQYAYEELRNVELAEVQRLEEQERRHREEKERRKQQQWEILSKHNETAQKIAAQAFAQRYLADLLPSVFGSLKESGYFYDPIERAIEIGFLPWLMNEVDKTMENNMVGRTVLDMLIREVVEKRLEMYEQKVGKKPSQKSENGLDGPETIGDLLVDPEFLGQNTPQTQRPFVDSDSLPRIANDGRYIERGLSQERRFVEEEGFFGQGENTEKKTSIGKEELQRQTDNMES